MEAVTTVRRDGTLYVRDHGFLELPDWKWRSAQPGDVWVPKRNREGRIITVAGAIGSKEYRCEPLIIQQVHNADRAVLCKDECDRLRSVKWTSLRRYWKPVTVREIPSEEVS